MTFILGRYAPLCAILWALAARAAPTIHDPLSQRQSPSPISTSQISSFLPFTHFASAAYCSPSSTLAWNCGSDCSANSDFIPTASGGDGTDVQFWYVGFSPSLNSVVVAHQGTDPSSLEADLTDADIFMSSLSTSLFPGISSSIEVHDGFQDEHAQTAPTILSEVQTTMSKHSTKSVTLVGHSLGAALALLDAVYLPLHLPSSTQFKTVTYGMPRVGNQAFANYVDAHITSLNGGTGLTRVTNKEDPIPIVPGRFLGFVHPSGEIHIEDSNQWDACPGQDNTSDLCIVGAVPNLFDSVESDHDGPYDGITMGSTCT